MTRSPDTQHRQQISLFIRELIGFTILFFVLGAVVYFLFDRSISQNIDSGIVAQKERILSNQNQPRFQSKDTPEVPGNYNPANPSAEAPFRTNFIVFNSKGKIMNTQMLGERIYDLFEDMKLNTASLNKIQGMIMYTSNGSQQATSHYFRTLLIKVPKSNPNPMYSGRYVLILENIDSDLMAIKNFRESLTITLIIFWILAIAIAYMLSRSSMKPILRSWKQQRDFSANAAHELKTPLTVIQNQMEYLLTKPKDKIMDQAGPISTTLDEVEHLKTLTNRLLILARSDANIVQIQKQDIQLKTYFEKILTPYKDIAASQSKTLSFNINVNGYGKLDSDLIRQLVIIILDNAIKYTPAGGSIEVTANRVRDKLNLEFKDTGEGIPDADKKLIFERFYRADRSRNSGTGGNGLGLAIAKWIVKQHKGTINVKDNKPKGTIFDISLPLG